MELLLMLIIVLGMMFVMSVQPMFMISMMILIIMLYSYMIYMIMGSYWFSYALMMVMLSGVLVVFTYMVSLIPNEKFDNYNLLFLMILLFMLMGGYYVWIYELKYCMISLNLWSTFFGMFNVFMVSFLLMIMLVVVWLSYMGSGALRVMY